MRRSFKIGSSFLLTKSHLDFKHHSISRSCRGGTPHPSAFGCHLLPLEKVTPHPSASPTPSPEGEGYRCDAFYDCFIENVEVAEPYFGKLPLSLKPKADSPTAGGDAVPYLKVETQYQIIKAFFFFIIYYILLYS